MKNENPQQAEDGTLIMLQEVIWFYINSTDKMINDSDIYKI